MDFFLSPTSYTIITNYLPRLLGIVYLIAFGGFLFQIRGLLGEHGILPIRNLLSYYKINLGKERFFYFPTLFWWNSSNKALIAVVVGGMLFSLLLILNSNLFFVPFLLLILALLHLSIVSAGQDFLSFGWEMTLLELTYTSILLSLSSPSNIFVWLSLNLLLFRLHFEGGTSKLLSGDKNWRNLSAIHYHYQSQPIPNVIAWYVHKWPLWFHKLSCAFMLFIEIIVPFAIFAEENIRIIVFILFVLLQLGIILTGNFSYLNYMTLIFSTILIGNSYLTWVPTPQPWNFLGNFEPILTFLGLFLLLLQLVTLWNFLFRRHPLHSPLFKWLQPFHIVNTHGIFAVMTTKRFEIVIEGSDDQEEWKEYTFYFKPSEITRRPRWFAPYHPRLDWRVWFLPFSTYYSSYWFQLFLEKLLQGSPDVLKLIRTNPFKEHPPKYIRTLLYDYEYSDKATKEKTGAWWKRTLVGLYSPTLRLEK